MVKRISLVLLIGLAFFLPFVQAADAQKYPVRPIEILVPYSPGSALDLIPRVVAEIAPKHIGQSFFVTNKPGAGGTVAAVELLSSKPDGYKLMFTANTFFAITINTQKIPFDPSHLVPLANFAEMKNGLIVKGDSSWKTLNDLLDFARKNPGKLKWAHGGRGNVQNIYGLLIFRKAGVETTDIPHKGSPEMLSALLGGHVEAAIIAYGPVKDHVRTGALRYLVTVGEKRYTDPPNIPSATELGFPEVTKLPAFVGLYAHKDTPEGVKRVLIDGLRKTYEDPEFKKAIEKIGEEPRFGGPEFMQEAIRNGEKAASPILKELGLFVGR